MKIGILRVSPAKNFLRAHVPIRLSLLAEMGFTRGMAVGAVLQQEGFTLTLHENGTANTSEKVFNVATSNGREYLVVYFSKDFTPADLKGGDFLAAKFEHGIITARKLPDADKYYTIGEENHCPFLLMCGAILPDAGFVADAISTASVINGEITINLWPEAPADYADIVKLARAQKLQIIQPYKSHETRLKLSPYLLDCAGFESGDLCGLRYDYGTMKLFKVGLHTLDF